MYVLYMCTFLKYIFEWLLAFSYQLYLVHNTKFWMTNREDLFILQQYHFSVLFSLFFFIFLFLLSLNACPFRLCLIWKKKWKKKKTIKKVPKNNEVVRRKYMYVCLDTPNLKNRHNRESSFNIFVLNFFFYVTSSPYLEWSRIKVRPYAWISTEWSFRYL